MNIALMLSFPVLITNWAFASPETAKMGSERRFIAAQVSDFVELGLFFLPDRWDYWVEQAAMRPLRDLRWNKALITRVSLPAQLDRHRDLQTRQLGSSVWQIGIAGDPGLKNYFLTFRRGDRLEIRPVGELKRLRGEGVNAEIEPGVTYNFRLAVWIFDPFRGSTIHMKPVSNTRGPSHKPSTGEIIDALKARAHAFKHAGVEYHALYSTDVDPNTNRLMDSRTFLFLHENGLSTRAWRFSESSLPLGQPVEVSFGDAKFILTRTGSELLIQGR
ncbi:MAG: hypothetical protein HY549_03355 [Elusimicrobia bacterium]|nr:hypothetical protein [Elusimicrobiota bacterium]